MDSILDQDLDCDNYEIIVINDGYLDSSIEIADDYNIRHNNIKAITRKNQGLSGTRNTRIKNALGQ